MTILGAILAGGRAQRFGADKALALHRGQPLIAHVATALKPQCAELVVCGREWGGFQALADSPAPGLGPMGGLCAALHHAHQTGHALVLCAPCDLIGLPPDTASRLAPAPAVADGQWLIGLWPVHLAPILSKALDSGPISARQWASIASAAHRPFPSVRNINRPADLG